MLASALALDQVVALLTLTVMEIVLGIDNIVFLSILTERLPEAERPRIRRVGLALALLLRLGLLFAIGLVMRLTAPWFEVFGHGVSGRDLILLGGGLFLVAKATWEIHAKLEVPPHGGPGVPARTTGAVLLQIVVLDLVFSLDSVITAVGMARQIWIMVVAMVAAVGVMLAFVGPISAFVGRHPTMKVLALAFLLLIGVMLVVEGTGHHIPRGYIYFAMAFSLGVEILNLRVRRRHEAVRLHPGMAAAGAAEAVSPPAGRTGG